MKTIGYLTIGYPDLQTSLSLAQAFIDGGCDALEIGIPTENPFMEGKSIFDKMKSAFEAITSMDEALHAVADFSKRNSHTELFPIFYMENFLRLGYERIISFCKECKITKILSVDMDQELIRSKLSENGIHFVSFAGFEADDEDVTKACENRAFVYMAAVPRPTDVCKPGLEDMKSILSYLRQKGTHCPIYCGGGIRTPEDVRKLRESGADGFFLGSSLMEYYNDFKTLKAEIQRFKKEAI